MIALPGRTFKRLSQARARLEIAAILNPGAYPEWLQEGRLSMAKVIDYLLVLREEDLKRRARNKKRAGGTTNIVDGEEVV